MNACHGFVVLEGPHGAGIFHYDFLRYCGDVAVCQYPSGFLQTTCQSLFHGGVVSVMVGVIVTRCINGFVQY